MKPLAMVVMVFAVGSIGAQLPAGVRTAPCERVCSFQEIGAGFDQSFDLLARLLSTRSPDLANA